MKKTKKIIALVLALITCFSAVSCEAPTESEVLGAYKELYPKAIEITRIIYGKGLPIEGEYDPDEVDSPHFMKVSDDSPYKTQAELEAAVLSVYTEDYYKDVLENVLFGGVESDENGLMGISPRYKETGGVLYIDVTYEQFLRITERDFENASVIKLKKRSATLKVPYSLNGEQKIRESTLVLTENGWRLDAMV